MITLKSTRPVEDIALWFLHEAQWKGKAGLEECTVILMIEDAQALMRDLYKRDLFDRRTEWRALSLKQRMHNHSGLLSKDFNKKEETLLASVASRYF